jgi:hypothetical protein
VRVAQCPPHGASQGPIRMRDSRRRCLFDRLRKTGQCCRTPYDNDNP